MGFTSNYGATSNTYETELPDNSGLAVGQVYESPNKYQKRMLVRNNTAGSTLALGAALKWKTADGPGTTGQGDYEVDATTATTDMCVGVNDASGGTVAAGIWFWMTFKGIAAPLVLNGAGQGVPLGPSGTAGVLESIAATDRGSNIASTVAQSGAGNTQTACWFY